MRGPKRAVAISGAASAALGLVVLMPLPAQAATTLNVGGAGCSDTPTSSATPYCTINAAVRAATAGDTISVGAGTYAEQVEVTKDVTIVTTSGATVTGAGTGGTAARSYGFRMTSTANGAEVRGFTVVATTTAGIRVDAASNVVIDDVDVSGSMSHGIDLRDGSNNIVRNVHSHDNTSIGIRLSNQTGSSVLSSTSDQNHNHGVSLQGGSGNRVDMVSSFANVNLPGAARTATGIDVSSSSTSATIEQNSTYGNGDSGIEIYPTSSNALVRRNVTYNNGDHGIDVNGSPGARIISNTVVGNATPGINVEKSATTGGASSGTLIRNNISVDNALSSTGTHGDIRVDAASISGTTLDYDLLWNSTAGTTLVEWGGADYKTLSEVRTNTGQESHGVSADPKFGDRFALTSTSPALDAADASVSGWLAADRNGNQPFDQAAVANTGAGSPPYADLGALELTTGSQPPPVDNPPTAKLTASPSTVPAGGTVTLDASGSSDDKGIVSYAFDCGNGTAVKTGMAKTTTCTYAAAGSFTAKVMVTDTAGKTAAATAPVTVTAAPPPSGGGGGGVGGSGDLAPTAKLSAPATASIGQSVTLDASGSSDDKGIVSYAFDCGNATAVKTGTAKTATCSYASAGSFTAKVTVKDTAGQTATATTTVKVSTGATGGPSAMLTVNDATVRQLVPVRLDAGGSTAGSAAIEDYAFNCGKGGADRTSSTATTTCRYRARGTYTATVVVTDADGHTSEATVEITVRRGGNPTARLRLSDRHVQRGERIIADASHSFGDRWWPVTKVRISCAGHSKTAHTVDLAMRCSFRHLGVHRTRLTVWNNLGHRDTVVRRIWVHRG